MEECFYCFSKYKKIYMKSFPCFSKYKKIYMKSFPCFEYVCETCDEKSKCNDCGTLKKYYISWTEWCNYLKYICPIYEQGEHKKLFLTKQEIIKYETDILISNLKMNIIKVNRELREEIFQEFKNQINLY